MTAVKEQWKQRVVESIREAAAARGIDTGQIEAEQVITETPPDPKLGDIAFPLFPFARIFRTAPAQIAQDVQVILCNYDDTASEDETGKHIARAVGPYIN
ncbi:MAG: arginine--tRNA ligase, partial [Sediminispirochaetaceae bacterium]